MKYTVSFVLFCFVEWSTQFYGVFFFIHLYRIILCTLFCILQQQQKGLQIIVHWDSILLVVKTFSNLFLYTKINYLIIIYQLFVCIVHHHFIVYLFLFFSFFFSKKKNILFKMDLKTNKKTINYSTLTQIYLLSFSKPRLRCRRRNINKIGILSILLPICVSSRHISSFECLCVCVYVCYISLFRIISY